MQKDVILKLLPAEAANDETIRKYIASTAATKQSGITGYRINKKSIDARGKQVFIKLQLTAFINEPFIERPVTLFSFKDVGNAEHKVLIIGAGPAGLFAALQLIEVGIQPIIIERGKNVQSRRRHLAVLNKEGIINPESNYCFGEGGAGTYSDGKLYTRSNKRGNIHRILQLFVHFGAPENILYDAHPHIGTNKLPQIITAMREQIIACGGKVLFDKKLIGINRTGDHITSILTADGEQMTADAYILATGHSARDIFEMLKHQNIAIESKPFALGVRVEHPQALINSLQYHSHSGDQYLPPASYSLVEQVNDRGVFSFCMCPGGIIAPASTAAGELVVNGWSPSKRNNPFANSGMVVQIDIASAYEVLRKSSLKNIDPNDPLLMMYFQQMVEHQAYQAGGGKMVAPAQRMTDFTNRTISENLPSNSYLPGLKSAALDLVLPAFVYDTLASGFKAFGKKMKGYFSNEAVVVATESRTSSPVRIPRHKEDLHHPQLTNLYPCAEGAGYAGGIVSAAMDGERIALLLQKKLLHL